MNPDQVFCLRNVDSRSKKLVKSYLLIMSCSDASFDSSSDSETAETEVEYDLHVEVKVISNVSEQKGTSDDDEPEDCLH